MLHRLDGRIEGPMPGDRLLQLCQEGRVHPDEGITRDSPSGAVKCLSTVEKLQPALEAGSAAWSARGFQTIPSLVEELRTAVVQIRTTTGSGSGFAIDAHGTILTNRHVVEDSSHCTVHFDSGVIAPGEVVHLSPRADLAVVRCALPTPRHFCLSERRGDRVSVGDDVLALGFPQDAGLNVTTGIISATDVRVSPKDSAEHSGHEWLRTSALINGGNSGGPVLDLRGRVAGMATWSQVFDNRGVPVTGMNYCMPHRVICAELREFRRLVSEGAIEMPTPEDLVRGANRPNPLAELDFAVGLICSRFPFRVIEKAPFEGQSRGFAHVVLASKPGDMLEIYVDSLGVNDGPLYVTMYCQVGELPEGALRSANVLEGLLRLNQGLPHWNLALADGVLRLRFSRHLELMDAVELLNAVKDLTKILNYLSSEE